MYLLKFLPEVAKHIGLVIKFKNDDEDDHVDGEQQENDQDELQNNLGAEAHLRPARLAGTLLFASLFSPLA